MNPEDGGAGFVTIEQGFCQFWFNRQAGKIQDRYPMFAIPSDLVAYFEYRKPEADSFRPVLDAVKAAI